MDPLPAEKVQAMQWDGEGHRDGKGNSPIMVYRVCSAVEGKHVARLLEEWIEEFDRTLGPKGIHKQKRFFSKWSKSYASIYKDPSKADKASKHAQDVEKDKLRYHKGFPQFALAPFVRPKHCYQVCHCIRREQCVDVGVR